MSHKNRHDISFHHQESHKIQLLEAIKTNTNSINVNVDTLEVNTDGLEGLQTTTNSKLDTINTTLTAGGIVDTSALSTSALQTAIHNRQDDILTSNNASKLSNATIATKMTSLESTNHTDLNNIYTRQDDILTATNAVKTNTQSVENCVSANKMNVNISSGIGDLATESTLQTIAEFNCDTTDVTISGSVLPSGASTSAKQGAGLPSALSSDNLKVSLKETVDVPVTNAGLTALNGTIGLNKVNVNLSSDAVGLSTSALQNTLNTKIDTIDSQIDLLEGTNTIKDVEWLSSESISNQSLSSVLDTEGYERVFIYGENAGNVSANNFKIFGSNESAGTYYSVGQLAVVTSDSGRYLLREDAPIADMPSPRYLKVFNNTGSSQTITKLRAVMSHKLRYV